MKGGRKEGGNGRGGDMERQEKRRKGGTKERGPLIRHHASIPVFMQFLASKTLPSSHKLYNENCSADWPVGGTI